MANIRIKYDTRQTHIAIQLTPVAKANKQAKWIPIKGMTRGQSIPLLRGAITVDSDSTLVLSNH